MATLPKQYDPKISEPHWQKRWEEMGVYAFRDDKPKAETFVIDTPPPTVSGVLHMGHIFSYTQADFIARYKRMRGFDVFYPMGFDDNGLPTERLVEKIKGVRGNSMPREEFVALCREVVKDAEAEFRTLFTGVALSVDWNQLYQTVSDRVTALSQASFLDLIAKGECYRDFRPGYWDWVDQTAIATAEIENKEMQGVMVELKFTIENGGDITIATTRPELLGACVAVIYHPEDANAAKYKNAHAITPLFGVKVPMIADEAVDKEFGTGLVMCCTFGDDTDKEWWRKYNLPMRGILGKEGKIRGIVLDPTDTSTKEWVISFEDSRGLLLSLPLGDISENDSINIQEAIKNFEALSGLKPKQAREKSIELLTAAGALVSKKDITHTVKCAERSGTPIEIFPSSQWFVKLTDKKEALKAKGAEVVWHPQHMKIRLDQWINGLKEDWCISRQRFFGVPFPVWYVSPEFGGEVEKVYARLEDLPVDPTRDLPYGFEKVYSKQDSPVSQNPTGFIAQKDGKRYNVTADKDVMDTWATSSISPQINAHSLSAGKLFPADLRPQAHEIIRTWAFYTIAKAHLHSNTIPWKNIMISGWCLAADKTKMSKSKGNVVTPVALIEDKGADAVRYWASTSRLATDTAFSEDLLKIGKKLVGKIWNASNLIAQLPSPATSNQQPATAQALDRWILSRLHIAVSKASEAFEQFEYCDARVAIEDFFWNDFCDNYLELVKARAYNEGTGQASALATLQTCLETILRLFAPFVPHVTEEIYSHLFAGNGSVHARGQWPNASQFKKDREAEMIGIACVDVLNIIRKVKSEANVSIKAPVAKLEIASRWGFIKKRAAMKYILPAIEDLKAAGNVYEVVESMALRKDSENPKTCPKDIHFTKHGWFAVRVTLAHAPEKSELAKVEDIKRNSEQSPDEKIEGKILSAPGKPDLSKHVVKVQVSGLATALERQK